MEGLAVRLVASFIQEKPSNLGVCFLVRLLRSNRCRLRHRADGQGRQREASQQSDAGGEEEEALHGDKESATLTLSLLPASGHHSPALGLQLP